MEPHFATSGPSHPRPDAPAVRRMAAALAPAGARSLSPAARDAHDAALWAALWDGEPLPAAELAVLKALAQSRQVAPGEAVLNRSGPAQLLVAVAAGEVALGLRTPDGTFRTERIVRGPAWLDLGSAWLDLPHAVDAQALHPATLLELPRQALQAALADQPALALRLIRVLAREVQALSANTHELMHKDAPARLAQWLHQRLQPAGADDPTSAQGLVTLHERKRDVAAQLAITPETLSRLMRSFTRLGVIDVAGYTVHVLDTAALAQLAAG